MDPPTQSWQCPRPLCRRLGRVRLGWRFCAAENRWGRAAEAPRSPREQAGTFLLRTAPWGLSYGHRQAKGCVSADSHVLGPEAQSRSSVQKAGGALGAVWPGCRQKWSVQEDCE